MEITQRAVTAAERESSSSVAMFLSPMLRRALEGVSLTERLLAASAFSVLMLFMQYSIEKWRIGAATGLLQWIKIFHAELLPVFLLFFTVFLVPVARRRYLWLLTAIYALCFANFVTWFVVNRPFQVRDVIHAAAMLQEYSEFVAQLGSVLLAKIVFFCVAPALIWAGIAIARRLGFIAWLTPRIQSVFGAAAVTYVALIPSVLGSSYLSHNSFVRMGREAHYQTKLASLSTATDSVYRIFGAPKPSITLASSTRAAVPARRNVIVFVIETAPSQYYPDLLNHVADDVRRSLAPGMSVARSHFTPYPESDRSIFSIMTGQYPALTDDWITVGNYQHSLPRALKAQGYTSTFISTAPLQFRNNLTLMREIGFDEVVQVNEIQKTLRMDKGRLVYDRSRLYEADEELVSRGLRVIRDHAQAGGSPYLLVLAPQASHAPFRVPPGSDAQRSDHRALIKANAIWQFRLVEQLVRTLTETEQLENTLLVVTGDHGIRSEYETTQLFGDAHLLSDVTYRVPFWLVAPGGPRKLSAPTSHIDIGPTILELLCVPFEERNYHGRSMLQSTDRAVFFLGGQFLPARGFVYKNRFYMENRRIDQYAVRDSFDFATDKLPMAGGHDVLDKESVHGTIAYVVSHLSSHHP